MDALEPKNICLKSRQIGFTMDDAPEFLTVYCHSSIQVAMRIVRNTQGSIQELLVSIHQCFSLHTHTVKWDIDLRSGGQISKIHYCIFSSHLAIYYCLLTTCSV